MSIEYGTGGASDDDQQQPAPAADARVSASDADTPDDGPVRPSDLVGAPQKASLPRWVPVTIAVAVLGGIGLGVLFGLVLGGGDDDVAAATTTITSATTTEAPGTTGATSTTAAPSTTTTPPTTEAPGTTGGSDVPGSDLVAFGAVEFEGEALPRLPEDGNDFFIGMAAPTLRGVGLDGEPIVIDMTDGRAKLIMFVSHWCPHCQDELPVVHDWLAATELPDNVDFHTVSTLTAADRANFPPGPWFVAEDWQWPVLMDDEVSTVAGAVGLNAVPFWMLVNTDGTLAARGPAALPPEALDNIVAQLSEGPVDEAG